MSSYEKRCEKCNERLGERMNYCPVCGKRYRRYWKSYFRPGAIVANIMFLGIAILILFYFGITTHSTNKNVVYDVGISLATALIPTTLITLLNSTILFQEHREKVNEDSRILTEGVTGEIEKVKNEIDSRLKENERFILNNSNLGMNGLVAAYLDRDSAFEDIYRAIKNEKTQIVITAISLKALIKCFEKKDMDVIDILYKKKQEENVKIKFILVHPAFAYLRELTEEYKRNENENMPCSVIESIKLLKGKFDLDSIWLASSVITIFGIMTSRYMILNPYPLRGKSYRNFTFVIDSLEGKNIVFNNYKDVHFTSGWNTEKLESFDESYLKKLMNVDIICEKLKKQCRK